MLTSWALHLTVPSFDDGIRAHQHRRWDGEMQSPGGREIDDELELDGLLHGRVARLRSAQDLRRHVTGLLPDPGEARTVGDQSAAHGMFPPLIDRGKPGSRDR